MRKFLYTIYDTATSVHNRNMGPMCLLSDGEALRMFKDLVEGPDNDVGKHPEDYNLIRVGEWDDVKGTLKNEANETLATGLEILAQSRQVDRQKIIDLDTAIAEGKHIDGTG